MSAVEELRRVLKARKLSYEKLGEEMGGLHRQHLWRVVTRKARCGPVLAGALEEFSEIKGLAWELLFHGQSPLQMQRERRKPEPGLEADLSAEDGDDDTPDTPPAGREKVTFMIDAALMERLRNIRWWMGGSVTMVGLVVAGIESIVRFYESQPLPLRHPTTGTLLYKAAGEPFPPREGDIPPGPVPS